MVGDLGLRVPSMPYSDVIAAVQGQQFSSTALLDALDAFCSDDSDESLWAGGRTGVVSGVILFMSSLRSDCRQQVELLARLVDCCVQLKAEHLRSGIDMVSSDQFLLEDVSAILFRSRLGAWEPAVVAELSDLQKHFVRLLKDVYRGHTYALLSAGVAPGDASIAEINALVDIYDL